MVIASWTEWSAPAAAEPHSRPRRGASARSQLWTIVGEYMFPHPGWTWTQTLVRALAHLDVDEVTARRALVRCSGEEWIERKQEGRRVRWRLSESGCVTAKEARERLYRFESGRSDWNGEWLLLLVTAPDDRTRISLRRRLGWAGFAVLPSGIAITPHVEREPEAQGILEQLDLGEEAVSFRAATGSIGVPRRVITSAWNLDDLTARYREFMRDVKAKRPRSDADVFVAHTHLVHEFRRFPYIDPGLPLEFLPSDWIGVEAKALFDDRYARWGERANRWFHELD